MLLAQGFDHAQDLVVGLALGQAGGQLVVQRGGLKEQAAASGALAGGVKLEPPDNIGTADAGQGIKRAADLAAIARHFGHALLVAVQLFQHHHRQVDVVLFKAEQAGRVV